ncbi:MAG: metal ABC transporter permease [Bernardetiaceae bacterium]|nr:metal ABC transporter permease [Bernardetiaceae bacterium]
MDGWLDFFTFRDANVRYVTLGAMLLGGSVAVVGVFGYLRKRSLAGDAVAHAMLPGICLGFLLAGQKSLPWLVGGAFASGWLALLTIDWLPRQARLKEDTAIGLVMSVFFGAGILLLTAIQHGGNAAQVGLEDFLFGRAAALVGSDLGLLSGLAVTLLLVVVVFYKELALLSFDAAYARAVGFPVRGLEFLLTTLTVLAVVAGIQAVGVVLTAALLVTPAAAARFWTHRLPLMLALAAGLGAFSGLAGAWVSYVAPAMPTGPWIVLAASALALGSFLLAPGQGLLARWWRQRAHRRKFAEENLLKLLYKMGERRQDHDRAYQPADLPTGQAPAQLAATLRRLRAEGYLTRRGPGWQLTPEGYERGRRITRLHRLWELYLTEYLRLAPDHVHDDAETMEHIITPEIEQELEKRLRRPEFDPHQNRIPYD